MGILLPPTNMLRASRFSQSVWRKSRTLRRKPFPAMSRGGMGRSCLKKWTVWSFIWTWERPDGGRSFGFSGMHYHDNWRLIEYRRLIAQSVLWTLKLPIPKEGLPVRVEDKDLQLK